MSVTIYGSSDDLIEVEGDVREEFNALSYGCSGDGGYIATSSGVLVRIDYSESGVWRIAPVSGEASVVQAPEDDEDNYSDVCTIEGDIKWVVLGSDFGSTP